MSSSAADARRVGQQVNGFYVHSSPPKVLQVHSSMIRQWLRSGDLNQLEQLVLEGQGQKLVGEYSPDGKVRAFLKQIPGFLVRSKRLHEAIAKGDLKQLQKLLNSRKNQESPMKNIHLSRNQGGLGLLHEAVYYGHPHIVEFLVSNFPQSIKMKDNDGRTPLHYSGASKEAGKIWPILLKAGADPNVPDSRGRLPGYYMERSNEIHLPEENPLGGIFSNSTSDRNNNVIIKPSNIRIWIHDRDLRKLQQVVWEGHGAKLRVETSKHPKVKRFLEGVPYILNIIKDVHSSVVKNDLEGFSKKTSHPVPPEVLGSKDANGLTPLHKAAGLNRWKIASEILKRNQSLVFAADQDGKTPLHYAAILKDGNAMYNLLTGNYADETAIDKNGKTASYYRTSPKEVATKVLEVIPEAPRTSAKFPPSFDWSLFYSEPTPAINHYPDVHTPTTNNYPDVDTPTTNNYPDVDTPIEVPEPQSQGPVTPTTETNESGSQSEGERRHGMSEDSQSKQSEDRSSVAETENGESPGEKPPKETEEPEETKKFEIWTNENYGEEGNGREEEIAEEEGGAEGEVENEGNGNKGEEGGSGERNVEGVGVVEEPRSGVSVKDFVEPEKPEKTEREIAEERQRLLDEGLLKASLEDEGADEEKKVNEMIETGDMEKLASMVLNGEGGKLRGKKSSNSEIQSFLDNVPIYMAKISGVHEAARSGSLKDLQAVLDRRKFAVAKESAHNAGLTPLHEAVIHGRVPIIKYLAGRFPETLTSADNFGRTALHYAAALGDRHIYDVLLGLGADPKAEDREGRTPGFYQDNPGELTREKLLNVTEVSNRDKADNRGELYKYRMSSNTNCVAADILKAPRLRTKRGCLHKSSGVGRLKDFGVSTPVTDPSIYDAEGEICFDEGIPLSKNSGNEDVEEDSHDDNSQTNFNITDRDEYGQSVLHFAAARAHGRGGLFQLIHESGINLGYRDELYRTARDIAQQANIPENVNEIDKYVISLAAKGETGKLVELFLEGYDHILDLEDDEDNDIMTIVSNKNFEKTLSFLKAIPALEEKRERVHRAIRAGDSKSVENIVSESKNGRFLIIGKNATGRCSLHIAVLCQQKDVTEFIAQKYPETLRIGDNLERTPLHYAMAVEQVETLSKILIKCGAKRVVKDLKGRQPTYYFMNKMEILKLQEEESALRR